MNLTTTTPRQKQYSQATSGHLVKRLLFLLIFDYSWIYIDLPMLPKIVCIVSLIVILSPAFHKNAKVKVRILEWQLGRF